MDIEYIIIDGKSTDKTLQIAKETALEYNNLNNNFNNNDNHTKKNIDILLSEKDSGLYDAMNKGIKLATSEYILFMNAGDTFFDKNTLKNIFENSQNSNNIDNISSDIFYGDAQMISEDTNEILGLRSEITPHKLPKNLLWQDMALGMVVCHQSFVVRRTLAPMYELKYRYSADVDWVIKCLKISKKTTFTGLTVANFLLGGLSTTQRKKSLKERFEVLCAHFGVFKTVLAHFKIVFRGIFFTIKKKKSYF